MPGGHGSRAAQCTRKWLCRFCKGRGDAPFVNHADKRACHRCGLPKGSCHLRDLPPASPSISAKAKAGAGGGGQQRADDPEKAALRLLVADLQGKIKSQEGKCGKDDVDGDVDMEAGVVDEDKLRKQLDTVSKDLAQFEHLVGPSERTLLLISELRAEKEMLQKQLASTKPAGKQVQMLGNKIAQASRAVERQRAAIKIKEAQVEKLNEELATDRKEELDLVAAHLELEREMAALVAANPTAPEGHEPADALPGYGCTIAQLGSLLQMCGLDTAAVANLTAKAAGLKKERDEAAATAAATARAEAAKSGAGGSQGSVGTGGQPAGASPTPPPPLPRGAGSPSLPTLSGAPADGTCQAGGAVQDFPMEDEDFASLRKELLDLKLIKDDSTEKEVRAVGERVQGWVVATAKKRQRLGQA